jgi:photosystem II stability/assembly factor-like uncharacterized protein
VAVGSSYSVPASLAATPKVYHWVSSDATGQVLLAGEASGGSLDLSTDGGTTWTTPAGLPGGTWISSDISATGDRLVAVQYQGAGMFMSTDKGVTWKAVTSPAFPTATQPGGSADGISFESVTMSQDGLHLVAVIQKGRLVISNDGGATWSAPTLPVSAGSTQNLDWRAVDSSADGTVIVAASQDGQLFRSTDSGVTFQLIVDPASATNPTPNLDNWYRVKVSGDGKTVVVVGNTFGGAPGKGIYVSHDQGATFTTGIALTIDYTAIALSNDGQTIAVTASTTGAEAGRVLLSTDGGTTFKTVTPANTTEPNWRATALSADGKRLVVAAGNFVTSTRGQLYLSPATP